MIQNLCFRNHDSKIAIAKSQFRNHHNSEIAIQKLRFRNRDPEIGILIELCKMWTLKKKNKGNIFQRSVFWKYLEFPNYKCLSRDSAVFY